jgi:hypothetical protein
MKAKIWVLCTVLADENAPAMPAVFADGAEAAAHVSLPLLLLALSLYVGLVTRPWSRVTRAPPGRRTCPWGHA